MAKAKYNKNEETIMSNQFILWLLLIVPWLSLPFIRKEDIRRFMPSAFFIVFACIIIYHIGDLLRFWYIKELTFPFVICGLLPVTTLWVLRFTYGQFWRYIITNALIDFVYAFVIIPWFGRRGILGVGPLTYVIVYVIIVILAVLIYGYQKWQEGYNKLA